MFYTRGKMGSRVVQHADPIENKLLWESPQHCTSNKLITSLIKVSWVSNILAFNTILYQTEKHLFPVCTSSFTLKTTCFLFKCHLEVWARQNYVQLYTGKIGVLTVWMEPSMSSMLIIYEGHLTTHYILQ